MHATVRRTLSRAAGAATALAVCAGAAVAQSASTATGARPVGVAVSGGANFLQGDFSSAFGTGFIVGGHVLFTPAGAPVGFRGDVNYQRNDVKSDVADNGSLSVISGFANAVLMVPVSASSVRPYAVGGVGVGRIKAGDDEGSASENKFGFQIGGGIDLPLSGIGAFAEVAYQRYSIEGGSIGFVPIRVGIRF
jgi:hypothetical protein